MNNGQLLFRVSFVLTHIYVIYVYYNYFVLFDQLIYVHFYLFMKKSRFSVFNLGENVFVIVYGRF